MQLVTWRPNLSRIWKSEDTLYLTITLSVKCRFCRARYTFTTGRHVVRKEGVNVGELLNWEMRAAFAPARCRSCGIAQRFPEQEKSKLRKEMEACLTPDWVKAQYTRPSA
jgi:hypothetical protein